MLCFSLYFACVDSMFRPFCRVDYYLLYVFVYVCHTYLCSNSSSSVWLNIYIYICDFVLGILIIWISVRTFLCICHFILKMKFPTLMLVSAVVCSWLRFFFLRWFIHTMYFFFRLTLTFDKENTSPIGTEWKIRVLSVWGDVARVSPIDIS